MARVIFEGLDELIRDMERHSELAPEIFDRMLEEGAEITKEAWKESATKHGHKDTGGMFDAIDYVKKPSGARGLKQAEIYPQGYQTVTRYYGKLVTRKTRVRLASVAFMRHYGTKKKAATYWVDDAVDRAAERVKPALEAIWADFLASKG